MEVWSETALVNSLAKLHSLQDKCERLFHDLRQLKFHCLCLFRIGTEHEKLGYTLADNKRLSYEQIRELLSKIQERFNWKDISENGNIIGLLQNGQSVTLEPGGQFELSGATLETVHQTCAEVNSHLYQVGDDSVGSTLVVSFLGHRADGLQLDSAWYGA